jgi:hypothetical protein
MMTTTFDCHVLASSAVAAGTELASVAGAVASAILPTIAWWGPITLVGGGGEALLDGSVRWQQCPVIVEAKLPSERMLLRLVCGCPVGGL